MYQYHQLNNGIRLIHKQTEGNVGHLAVIINTGSRDENTSEHGVAHFIEHLIFKGTAKRKAYHILSRLEDVGGEIDAFTTKEETCLTASFLKNYYPRTFELFSDILFHSTFPEKELEKEKEVIFEEINLYKDSPSDLIFDEFENLIFKGHPLGRGILGEPEQLKKYQRNDLLSFIKNNYHTDQIVLSSVGNEKFEKIVSLAEKYFATATSKFKQEKRQTLNIYTPENQFVKKHICQTHCILGNRAYSIENKNRLALELINNVLGGPGMNSRLNLSLRERCAYVYSVESFYSPYSDTGVIGIYFATEHEKFEKSLKIVKNEIKKLQTKPLGILQLEKAKKQMMGQIAIHSDNNQNLVLGIGRSFLLFDKMDSLENVYKKIDQLTSLQLMEVANDVLNLKRLSMLSYGNF